jgi:hypothetical protein
VAWQANSAVVKKAAPRGAEDADDRKAVGADLSPVIAGLDPAIHPLNEALFSDGCAGQARA